VEELHRRQDVHLSQKVARAWQVSLKMDEMRRVQDMICFVHRPALDSQYIESLKW
jgi:hypothetical protein